MTRAGRTDSPTTTLLLTVAIITTALAACGPRGGVVTQPEPAPVMELDAAVCEQADELGQVDLDDTQAALRRGQTAEHVGDIETTLERPIEVCGVSGELQWLTSVTCADDSEPYRRPGMTDSALRSAAHASRTGSAGPGGACGNIIDLYAVPCPEKIYEVHIDLYMCGPGESAL